LAQTFEYSINVVVSVVLHAFYRIHDSLTSRQCWLWWPYTSDIDFRACIDRGSFFFVWGRGSNPWHSPICNEFGPVVHMINRIVQDRRVLDEGSAAKVSLSRDIDNDNFLMNRSPTSPYVCWPLRWESW